jgi:hypothetical protein
MVDLTQLANALVDTFQRIPELVAALNNEDPDSVFAYLDSTPDRNSLTSAIYEQPAGTVMVAWDETGKNDSGDMSAWEHRYFFTCRAATDQSSLALINLLVDGVPVPGDGQRWRYCPVMDGVNAAEIIEITRIQDREGIDYHAIHARITETGDA